MTAMLVLSLLLFVEKAPPLPPAQIAQIQTLVQTTETQDKKIKAQLVERQKELSQAYARVELDSTRINDLQEDIVELQKQLLANYHNLQVEIRKIVGPLRFHQIKRRVDMVLASAAREAEAVDQVIPEDRLPSRSQSPDALPAAPTISQPLSSGVSVVPEQEGWRFYEDGRPVMFYRTKARDLNGSYARADYVHPLVGLDGTVITEDFPRDHLHHRGIFWTWHQVIVDGRPMGDAWGCQDFIWDVRGVRVLEQGLDTAALQAKVYWLSPRWKQGQEAFVEETVTLRLFPHRLDQRVIDFTIALRALEDDVLLGGSNDDKGYGGFTARVATPDDTAFTGTVGPVTPQRTPVFGGPWMNLSGTMDGQPYGVAILQHPQNPLFPETWILRHVKRFSNMQNPVYPWRYPVRLPTESPVVLRYRLIVHKGADIAKAWQAYRDMYPVK